MFCQYPTCTLGTNIYDADYHGKVLFTIKLTNVIASRNALVCLCQFAVAFLYFYLYNEKKGADKMTVEEIRNYMKKNKISQKQLSEKTGIPKQTLWYILSNRTQNPRIDTMQAIENALGFVSPTAVSQFTEKENELIRLYRALPNEQLKARVFAYVIGLLEGAGVDTKRLI